MLAGQAVHSKLIHTTVYGALNNVEVARRTQP